ncbi:MAG: ornithine cyclodeaminase family protein [Gemmatimonadetes bacterium]|nr:ornithine cyclodeaminase family protein [Gemmatimonadota bacterium]
MLSSGRRSGVSPQNTRSPVKGGRVGAPGRGEVSLGIVSPAPRSSLPVDPRPPALDRPTTAPIPFLDGAALSALGITAADAVAAIERVIRQRAAGTAQSAAKAVMLPPDGRYLMAALAATDEPPLLVTKSVVLNPRNPARRLPQVDGVVTVLDAERGTPVMLLDAKWITAVRTAALSLTAARHLARADSAVIAFAGCGVQARSHLAAFAAVTDLAAPWHRASFAALDRVVIDDLAQEAAMPNKLLAPEVVAGDLSGLVLGELPGRGGAGERTAFVFRGHALGDLALAVLACERAGLVRSGASDD